MKVLYVSHYGHLGGANQSLLNLVDGLSEKGIEPYVAIPEAGPIVEELKSRQVPHQILKYGGWVRTIGTSNLMKEKGKLLVNHLRAWQLAQYIKKEGIKLVHTNDSCTIVGRWAAKMAGVPHVWHIREFLDEDYHLEVYMGPSYARKMFQSSEAVIVISKAIEAHFKEWLKPEQTHLIYNGVTYEERLPEKKQNEVFTLLFAGGGSPEKGALEVIEAIRLLVEQGTKAFKVLVVGNLGKYKEMIEEFICDYSLQDYIEFLGYRSDMKALRTQSDLALVCSYKEAFGRVTVEAMLAGLPVLGAASGATVELIRQGENGWLYKRGSAQALAEQIQYAMTHPEELMDIRKAAFEEAKEKYTYNRLCQEVYQLYQTIMN